MMRYEGQFDQLTIMFDLPLYLYLGFLVAFIFLLRIFTTDNITLFQNYKGGLSLMTSRSNVSRFGYTTLSPNLISP